MDSFTIHSFTIHSFTIHSFTTQHVFTDLFSFAWCSWDRIP
jgi:hypothetical protein